LLDTRDSATPLVPDHDLVIQAVGRCGIGTDAAAVALSVTVTESSGDGFVTAWPSDVARPATSTINFAAGETRANGGIIGLSADGRLTVSAAGAATHLVVDLTGVFERTDRSRAGRFVPIAPQRLIDTRDTGQRLAPGAEVTLPLPRGVPRDATALALSIATAETIGAGYFTAYAAGTTRPTSSLLNTDGPDQIRATGQIVPVSADGFTVFSQTGEHLIIDVSGWFTGPSSALSPNGLFVPTTPVRVADTRAGSLIYPTGEIEMDLTALSGGPAVGFAANWTMTDTWRSGFLTVYPARTPRPLAAMANSDHRHQTVSQFGIGASSTAGLSMYSSNGSHVLVDVTGWFLGLPRAATLPTAPANTPVADTERRVLMVGDSTLAGIRWYPNSQHALGGSNFTLDVESCRRLVGSSCYGRERRTAPNALNVIEAHESSFDTVVIMTGYNDWAGTFSDAFDQIVAASRAKGAQEILWLTYREGTNYVNPSGGTRQDTGMRQQNEILRQKVASGAYPDVRLLDYNTYTAPTTGWFTKDGVHFTIAGAYGTADYISRQIAFGHGEPCPAPWTPGEGIETPCSDPDAYPGLVDPMTLYAGNPNDVHCYEVGSDHHINCRVDPKLH
jgi:hypothetical protein